MITPDRPQRPRLGGPGSAGLLLAFLLGCGALVPGCGGAGSAGSGKPISYRDSARGIYEKGLSELKDESFPEATKYFTFVKNKFPFSAYATLAELRLADALFAQEKYLEAIDSYRLFLKFHPTHPEVTSGYVSYKICSGYVEQIPSDWFLIPPSHEKDQAAAKDALRELTAFLRNFPQSPHLSKVQALRRRCTRKLADHELYVARFYLDRDKPKATILRLETLLRQYPDAGMDPEVMLLLGQTYFRLEQHGKARQTLSALIEKYPRDPYSAKAKLYLQLLSGQRK